MQIWQIAWTLRLHRPNAVFAGIRKSTGSFTPARRNGVRNIYWLLCIEEDCYNPIGWSPASHDLAFLSHCQSLSATNMRHILILVACSATWTASAAQEANVENLLAQSDPAIQARISALFDSRSELEEFRQVEKLREVAGDEGKDDLVKQLAIFVATSPTSGEFHVLQTLRILQRLDIQPSIIIRVLSPYLGSENERLRNFARESFQGYDKAAFEDPFKAYTSFVGNRFSRGQKVPTEFVKYIFERSPDRALLVFNRAAGHGNIVVRLMEMRKKLEADLEERRKKGEDLPPLPPVTNPPDESRRQRDEKLQKEIMLAEHIVSNAIWLNKHDFDDEFDKTLPAAKQQLLRLSKHDEWWVRLYVATIMRRHRELRLADVLGKLSHDSNDLVKEAAQSVNG